MPTPRTWCSACGVQAEVLSTAGAYPQELCAPCASRHALCCQTCDRRGCDPGGQELSRGSAHCQQCLLLGRDQLR